MGSKIEFFQLIKCRNDIYCVNSLYKNSTNWIAPICVKNISHPLSKLQEALFSYGTATILQINDELIHVKFKFPFLGWEDEFFFEYFPENEVIHIHAKPINHTVDLGINRSRIEQIRHLIVHSSKN